MTRQVDIPVPTEVPPPIALLQMITGKWLTQAVYVAARLGIADLLGDGPKTIQQLAKATDSNPSSLYRLLRALASLGIFAERDDQHFELTPIACLLQTGVPGSLRAMAIFSGGLGWQPWGEMLHSVRTGRPAFEQIYGITIARTGAREANFLTYLECSARLVTRGVIPQDTMAKSDR